MNSVQLISIMFAAHSYAFDKNQTQEMFTGNATKNFSETERMLVTFLIDLMRELPEDKVLKLISKRVSEITNDPNKKEIY